MAKFSVDSEGGVLIMHEIGVSLVIPSGAIQTDTKSEYYLMTYVSMNFPLLIASSYGIYTEQRYTRFLLSVESGMEIVYVSRSESSLWGRHFVVSFSDVYMAALGFLSFVSILWHMYVLGMSIGFRSVLQSGS